MNPYDIIYDLNEEVTKLTRQLEVAKASLNKWESVFGHLGTPDEVGNEWAAMSDRLEAVEKNAALLERLLDARGSSLNAVANECDALRADKATLQQMTYSLKDRLEVAESSRRDDYQNWMTALDRNAELLAKLEAAEKEVEFIRQGISFRDDVVAALAVERDALRAKITEMEKQEPAGTLHDDGCFVWRETAPHQSNYAGWKTALYALPGAKGETK